jgi:hypothetical protein
MLHYSVSGDPLDFGTNWSRINNNDLAVRDEINDNSSADAETA